MKRLALLASVALFAAAPAFASDTEVVQYGADQQAYVNQTGNNTARVYQGFFAGGANYPFNTRNIAVINQEIGTGNYAYIDQASSNNYDNVSIINQEGNNLRATSQMVGGRVKHETNQKGSNNTSAIYTTGHDTTAFVVQDGTAQSSSISMTGNATNRHAKVIQGANATGSVALVGFGGDYAQTAEINQQGQRGQASIFGGLQGMNTNFTYSRINQIGNDDYGYIENNGTSNNVQMDQFGNNDNAIAQVYGYANTSYIRQESSNSEANLLTRGDLNNATLNQFAGANGSSAFANIAGNNNTLVSNQSGAGSHLTVSQLGDRNRTIVNQK